VMSETVLFQCWWLGIYALGLWLVLHSFLVAYEEPQLRRRFGQVYLDYCASTPRWIPRQPRRSPWGTILKDARTGNAPSFLLGVFPWVCPEESWGPSAAHGSDEQREVDF